MDLSGKTILLTGASEGIGREMALLLGERAGLLVLTSRSPERLDELASSLSCATRVVPCDLSERSGTDELLQRVADLEIDVLINNAAFGIGGEFLAAAESEIIEMLELNVVAVTRLMRRLIPEMIERRRGAVLNVGSTAAFQPVPFLLSYSATKSYVNHVSEGLDVELAGTGVRISCLSPGTTRTGFHDRAGTPVEKALAFAEGPATVARRGIRALERGQRSKISGIHNWWMVFMQRFVPRRLVTAVAGMALKP